MTNKNLDEDKIVIVEMNKRIYHLVCGLVTSQGLTSDKQFKLLGERKKENKKAYKVRKKKENATKCVLEEGE